MNILSLFFSCCYSSCFGLIIYTGGLIDLKIENKEKKNEFVFNLIVYGFLHLQSND